jgi:hypothetical protein
MRMKNLFRRSFILSRVNVLLKTFFIYKKIVRVCIYVTGMVQKSDMLRTNLASCPMIPVAYVETANFNGSHPAVPEVTSMYISHFPM